MQTKKINLYKSEVIAYFSVYIIYIVYELWMLIEARHKIWKISGYDFPQGWPIFNSLKDDTNDELYAFNEYIKIYWPCYIFHLAATTVIRKFNCKWQSLTNAIICLLILLMTMKLLSIALVGCLVLSYYFIARKHSKMLTWLLSVLWMVAMIFLKSSHYLQEYLGYIEFHNVMVTLCWSILRGCSFSLQYEKSYRLKEANLGSKYNLSHFLGYTLYFPCLMLGPFMGYHRYIVLDQANGHFGITNCRKFLWQIAKVIFWWLILEVATHYVYVHYMAVDIAAVEILDTKFGLYAVGYFMGQFFFMFYVISYGLGIAFAQYDGLNPPRKPRCIGLVHYYSDMWKYFDEGLYEFLFSHIYAEMCNKTSSALRKVLATAATFSFVFLWHGYYGYVFIWSILNFCCLVGEKIVKFLIKSPNYIRFMKNNLKLTEAGLQRFNALLGSQIFIPAAFSNCYFISGLDVGNYLMKGVYQGGWWNYLTLTFCTYCFFQCCEIILQTNYVT
ncbi:protein-cysteine N-palmitoyltransferase Rasp [Lucilia cuprina]|uniref:protein-cysteine N-palmitoyltransferase Rasp n=1 Tax=Lucilia cuprina TaxID=7375 RepID=UPI001F062A0B|nr:protein-cysteine N-palmitoyltransferase Rasp [Lucilia cuprina]